MIAGIVVASVTAAAIWLTFSTLRPTPPRSVAMAIDPEGSFSAELGRQYREFLGRNGIDLKLAPTAGGVQSLALLRDPKSEVSIAIITSGMTNAKESPELVSLGTLFYEPFWVFSRSQHRGGHAQPHGLRISIGSESSSTHVLALEFLGRIEIDQKSATLLSLPPQESAKEASGRAA